MLIIDSSGSVNETIEHSKRIATKIIDQFNVDPNSTHISIVKFAGKARTLHSFSDNQTKQSVLEKLNEINLSFGTTAIHAGLLQGISEFTQIRDARLGKAQSLAVIFTDGFGQKDMGVEAELLRETASLYAIGINHQVVHSNKISIIHELLLRATKMNMTSSKHSFLFTHPDLSLLDDFLGLDQQYQCNISGIRLVQKLPLIKTELALAIDAVQLFGHALKDMARKMIIPHADRLLCYAGDVWQNGKLFNNALQTTIAPEQNTGTTQLAKGQENAMARENVTLIGVSRVKDNNFKDVFL